MLGLAVAPQHSDRSAIMTAPSLVGRGRRQSTATFWNLRRLPQSSRPSGTLRQVRLAVQPRHSRCGSGFFSCQNQENPCVRATTSEQAWEKHGIGTVRLHSTQFPRSDLFIHRHSRSEISSRLSVNLRLTQPTYHTTVYALHLSIPRYLEASPLTCPP